MSLYVCPHCDEEMDFITGTIEVIEEIVRGWDFRTNTFRSDIKEYEPPDAIPPVITNHSKDCLRFKRSFVKYSCPQCGDKLEIADLLGIMTPEEVLDLVAAFRVSTRLI